jgi:hypothetical protein
MTDKAETFMASLAGREIEVREVSPGQLMMLQRFRMRAQALLDGADPDPHNMAMVDVLNKSLMVVDSLIVHQEDREFIEEAMLTGKLDHLALLALLSGKPEDPKKKTVAKRSPKAAPGKAAAPRGRTKR